VSSLPVHHGSAFDHRWLVETVQCFQSFLLRSYEWVLFVEIDEFVFPMSSDPQHQATLLDYVRGLGATPPPAIRATGFEIVQQDGEPPVPSASYADGTNVKLSLGELIAHRKWWYRSSSYSKTLLANTPLRWQLGFHEVDGPEREISTADASQSLILLHLHKVDFDLALGRLRRSRARKWSQHDVEAQLGWQNRADDERFRAFWEMDRDPQQAVEPECLPPILSSLHALRT
jgi:hypothetical protein